MKNKKGFSLIELLAIIIIIGLILIVALPAVTKLLKNNNNKQYDKYYEIVKAGALRYSLELKDELGGYGDTGCFYISLADLIEDDIIEAYNDKKITCEGKIRLDNVKGNISASVNLTCKNKKDVTTYEVNNIEESECIAFVPKEPEPSNPINPNNPGSSGNGSVTLVSQILKDNTEYADNVKSEYVGASTGIDFSIIGGIGPYRSVRSSTNETSYFSSTYKYATGYTFDSATGKYTLTGTFYSGSPSTMSQLFATYTYTCKSQTGTTCSTLYDVATASPDSSAWTAFIYSSVSVDASSYNGQGLYYTNSNTEDNQTAYYYRGNVDNNFVQFGKNNAGTELYWRVIRINEDGSIRLIYNGTSTSATGDDVTIGNSEYNTGISDNTYVGYMYGTPDSSSYISTHSNTNSSTVKTVLDNWYVSNLSSYSNYISMNTGFCNDRSLHSGTGINEVYTEYGPYNRLNTTKKPQFKCTNAEDLFTTNTSTKGNKKLNYPVGLITSDEVVYAGGALNLFNADYYLYSGKNYWTISPSYYEYFNYPNVLILSRSIIHSIGINGELANAYTSNTNVGVRPVINLKLDVELTNTLPSGCTSQNGTANCPYIVKTS